MPLSPSPVLPPVLPSAAGTTGRCDGADEAIERRRRAGAAHHM